MRFRCFLAGLWLFAILFSAQAFAQLTEEVLVVPTRVEVTVPVLLTGIDHANPKWVFVLLSGGYGDHLLSQRGTVVQIFNDQRFLARTRALFAAEDSVSALVDVPSDQNRLSDDFRRSAAHMADLRAVLSQLRQRFPAARVVLVGHSNGTLSVATAALALSGQLDRVVLVSGRLVAHWYGGEALSNFDFSKITLPMLLVHHRFDDCSVTPYSGAKALVDRFQGRFPLITVGASSGGGTGGCSSQGSHNLNGTDGPVVGAIRAWALEQPWPAEID